MSTAQREFDIVIYGATGFVGKLTAEYLSRAGTGVRIALAGRSPDRLAQVRGTLGDVARSWPILIADASAPETLREMATRTRVVVTTVGPYIKYGLPLVEACAEAGTDYVDLTGEPNFVLASIDGYHKQAVDTGARIVHSCGFDSIPSDLTVFGLYRRADADGAGQLLDTTMVVRTMVGGVSGGTTASMLEVLTASSRDPQLRRDLEDPYTLSPDRGAEPELGGQSDVRWRRGADVAAELRGHWLAPFVMAMPNSRIVRRSNALLGHAYGRRMSYGEQMTVGTSVVAPVAAAALAGVSAAAMNLGSRFFRFVPRKLVDRMVPAPGTGPARRPARTVTTGSRPTRRRPRAPGTARPSPSRATSATRRRRCCSARARWPWCWIGTACPTSAGC